MRARSVIGLPLVFCSFVSLVRPQEPPRAADFPTEPLDTLVHRNRAGTSFERNLNTFNWIGHAMVDTVMTSTRLTLREQYTSNVIQIDASGAVPRKRLQSNQQTLSLGVSHPITSSLSGVAQVSSLSYSDDKAVGLSTAASHAILGGFAYWMFPFLSFSPLAGYRWENQLTRNDRGLSYMLGARTQDVDLDGYALEGNAQFHQDRLDPRLLERHFAQFSAQKTFLGQTRDSLALSFSRNRREFYGFAPSPASRADNTIESRIDNVFSFANLLDYEVDQNFLASLYVNVTNRSLDRDIRTGLVATDSTARFDTQIQEFRLDTYAQAVYRSDDRRGSAVARFSYSERDENHRAKPVANPPPNIEILFNTQNRQEQTKDNLSRRTTIAGSLGLPLSRFDDISLSGAASLLHYDTPSELNVEDRDELLIALTLATRLRISQVLLVSLSVDGSISHLVYLLKERSANNNYNRILRLSPRVEYRPVPAILSANTFEVLANYTVYDYEQQVALVRSFSYRQFGWMDSTSIDLTSRIGIDFFSYLKLYERGQLRWSDFTERPENSFVDKTYSFQVRFTPLRGSLFAVGIQYFSQSRYVYESGRKRLEAFLRSVGPTCRIDWEINSYSTISMRGWYEERMLADGTLKSLPNMNLNVSFHF